MTGDAATGGAWTRGPAWVIAVVGLLLGMAAGVVIPSSAAAAVDPCAPVINPVACENSKPGTPSSEWQIIGTGDSSIEGFATDFSVDAGQTVSFKVRTNARSYHVDIYRLGWYQGNGARKVATISPSASLPQSQPSCLEDAATGLIDCGNWGVSASWSVPSSAVSGVYLARLVRDDTGGDSHIPFVVRDDDSTSALLFQTSDTTWQAYNLWGGNSLYEGEPAGRAYKVSYNRPFLSRSTPDGRDFLFSAEYPMIRFLERNGYDVSYFSGIDSDRHGSLIRRHRAFLSVGHDEYWSGAQRANVEAARDAGVHLAFFSGNEVYWKTRWEPSIAPSATPYRTLVSYKETRADAKIDPSPEWTGTWRDARFSPPSDGGRPENALTGTIFTVNCCAEALTVPQRYSRLRLWRNTSVATLAPGAVATFPFGTLGYEWDEDLDNGARPPGLIHLSSSTYDEPEVLQDEGKTVAPGTATHHLTMYRATSGALVFGAGTVQWSWGLDPEHDGATTTADVRMQQATVNLFADMGVQPGTVMDGLVAATASSDTTPPTVTITSPAPNASLQNGTSVTLAGTANDAGGVVAAVEVSTDGGTTWKRAEGTANWTYQWAVSSVGPTTVLVRAVDDSVNVQPTPAQLPVVVTCPCYLLGPGSAPATASSGDGSSVEVGVKFQADVDGWVTGIRFYKGPGNGGTHTATLWTAAGSALATATFTGETSSGWQEASFAQPVSVAAGATYVASYHAPTGNYAATAGFFNSTVTRSPLRAPSSSESGGNGVYRYGPSSFPTDSFGATNYWVDPVFTTSAPPDDRPPAVVSRAPIPDASSVPPATTVRATLDEAIETASLAFTLQDGTGGPVPAAVAWDATTRTATLTPSATLAAGTTYTASLQATDRSGNAMPAPVTWSFRTQVAPRPPGVCPCSLWTDADAPASPSSDDGLPIEVGVRFRSDADGLVTGVRFYKGAANVGPHTVTLWSPTGAQLATAAATGESSEGWQEVRFATPVAVTAGTIYTASYHTDSGRYAVTPGQFLSGAVDAAPLHAPSSSEVGGNGVYRYGASGYPTSSFGAANYWVDVVFEHLVDETPPTVVQTTPGEGATSVPVSAVPSALFSEPMDESTLVVELRDATGAAVPGSVRYDPDRRSVAYAPASPLAEATTYTAAVVAGADRAGNALAAPTSWSFRTSGLGACPCSLFETTSRPAVTSASESNELELGLRFRAEVDGWVTAIRFYKGAGNLGPHTGSLWDTAGRLLANVTFGGETESGWQQAELATAVALQAGTTYIVSYHAPSGHYAADPGGLAAQVVNSPLLAPADSATEHNGVFSYGPSSFPQQSFGATNYWVDVVFTAERPPDATPPTVSSVAPADGATTVPPGTQVRVTFSEPVRGDSVAFALTTAAGAAVPGSLAYDDTSRTAVFTPAAPLAEGTVHAAAVTAALDLAGNALAAPVQWSFTTATPRPPGACPCSLWSDTTVPGTAAVVDTTPTEVGVRFTADRAGYVVGLRFYKGVGNTGPHVGHLWSADGTRLAEATFGAESTSGWQEVAVTPVPVTAGTPYVASYFAPAGRYAAEASYFRDAGVDAPPLHAPRDGDGGANGVYRSGSSGFPDQTFGSTNYFVDVLFAESADATAPTVVSTDPAAGATGVPVDAAVSATFDEAVVPTSVSFTLTAPNGVPVPGTLAHDATSRRSTFTPSAPLAQGVTHTAAVSASDAAGNAMASPRTWSFSTVQDTAAPVISELSASITQTTATIRWTTDEPADSTVQYGTTATALTATATDGARVTEHVFTLTGLAPNQRYFVRVRSADASGNTTTAPDPTAPPLEVAPAAVAFTRTSTADFASGTVPSGAYLAETADGEVTLAPLRGAEFGGTALPGTWTSAAVVSGGTSTVGGGVLTVDGALVRTTNSWGAGRRLELAATFSATEAGQEAGLGVDATTSRYASFITGPGGELLARSAANGRTTQSSSLGTTWTGAPHVFRIDWAPSSVTFSIDGAVVATHAISITNSMRPLAVDRALGGTVLTADWIRLGPYAASATYTGSVIDASATVAWGRVTRDGTTPAGTSLVVQVRTGPTPTPGTGWSAWTTVIVDGSVGTSSRYLQWRTTLTTSGSRTVTPSLDRITFDYSIP